MAASGQLRIGDVEPANGINTPRNSGLDLPVAAFAAQDLGAHHSSSSSTDSGFGGGHSDGGGASGHW